MKLGDLLKTLDNDSNFRLCWREHTTQDKIYSEIFFSDDEIKRWCLHKVAKAEVVKPILIKELADVEVANIEALDYTNHRPHYKIPEICPFLFIELADSDKKIDEVMSRVSLMIADDIKDRNKVNVYER